MTSSVASRPGFLRWLVTAGDPATLVATFSTAAGSPVNLSGSTVAAACANWSTSHAGSATVGGASNNEVTVAFTDTITGQLTGGGWTWTLTVDGVTTLAGPLDVAQPGVAGVTGGDASAVVVVDDVNVAVTVVGGGGGGAVDSVNGQTGVVVLGAADVSADPAGTAAGLVDDLSGVTAPATALATLGGLSTTGGGKDTVSDLGSMTGAVTVDLANGNSFHGVLSGNVTSWTLLNATSGKECEAIIEITQHASSAKTVAYPSAWKWAGGTDHVMSTGVGAVDVIVLRTRDGGTTIHAAVMGKAFD